MTHAWSQGPAGQRPFLPHMENKTLFLAITYPLGLCHLRSIRTCIQSDKEIRGEALTHGNGGLLGRPPPLLLIRRQPVVNHHPLGFHDLNDIRFCTVSPVFVPAQVVRDKMFDVASLTHQNHHTFLVPEQSMYSVRFAEHSQCGLRISDWHSWPHTHTISYISDTRKKCREHLEVWKRSLVVLD